jgi:PIN domain nuclease of toxin-antitoxin system
VILLDTHALIWMASDPKRLSGKAREAIRSARQNSGVAIAGITLWEVAWLAYHGRIVVAGSVENFIRGTVARVIIRHMTPEIAALAVSIQAGFPKDPADRIIAATAMIESMPLVTADEGIRAAKIVETIW